MSNQLFTRRSFLKSSAAAAATTSAALGFSAPLIAENRELVIISNRGNADQRAALEKIAQDFGKEAGVKVSVNNMDHEAHKTAIRNYLVASPPDINFWFSGERMRGFVDKGLFADISELVEKEGWTDVVPAMGATSVDGRQYGLPTAGILWGMWYRQDTFDELGFSVPETYDDFFTLQSKAAGLGMTPVSIGTKNNWPAAGWFDHMNLRINGLEHHQSLMQGKIAYTDDSLKKVLDSWAELINAGLFSKNMTSYAWEQAAAALVQKKAAMMDLGGFISYAFPEDERDQLRFAPFPTIDASIPRYEDYSVDSIHIPAKAKNPGAAREFLSYFYRADNLKAYLEPEGNVPARLDVDMSSNPMVSTALKAMEGVAGTAQYFDRDTNPDVAQAGLKAFQEFMVYPDRAERLLANIERSRERVYGSL